MATNVWTRCQRTEHHTIEAPAFERIGGTHSVLRRSVQLILQAHLQRRFDVGSVRHRSEVREPKDLAPSANSKTHRSRESGGQRECSHPDRLTPEKQQKRRQQQNCCRGCHDEDGWVKLAFGSFLSFIRLDFEIKKKNFVLDFQFRKKKNILISQKKRSDSLWAHR